ncbi:glycosyltransferase [Patescibacteria group bacterium]|nr:glycosyltransferase [Patescibacteria group bacterium]
MTLVIDAVGASTGGNITILNNISFYLLQIDSKLNIHIYIEQTPFEKYFLYQHENIEYYPVQNKTLIQKIIWQQYGLHKKVKNDGGDILLSITNIGSAFAKIPQIVYFHQALLFISNRDLWRFFSISYYIRFKILKFFVLLGFLRASAVIVQTQTVKENILKEFFFLDDRIHAIHSGVPKIFEHHSCNWQSPNDLNDFVKILYVAHPSEYKNFDILFETAKLAKEKNLKFVFLLTLDEVSKDQRYQGLINTYLEMISKYALEPHIRFIGVLKNSAEMEQAYHYADVVIHPSFVESFPQTLTEAMQFGKPLISANLGYANEIAAEASIYFNPHDPQDLLDKITDNLFSENARHLWRDKSLERVKTFGPIAQWGKLYTFIEKIYQKKYFS